MLETFRWSRAHGWDSLADACYCPGLFSLVRLWTPEHSDTSQSLYILALCIQHRTWLLSNSGSKAGCARQLCWGLAFTFECAVPGAGFQPQHCRHLSQVILCCGAVLGRIGCSVACLAFTGWEPINIPASCPTVKSVDIC